MRRRLDPGSADYAEMKRKSNGYIYGGLLLIVIGGWKFYTRYFVWGWR